MKPLNISMAVETFKKLERRHFLMKHLALTLTVIGLATMLLANTASAQSSGGQYSYYDSKYYSGNFIDDYDSNRNLFEDYHYSDYEDYQMNESEVTRFFNNQAKIGN